MFISLHCVSNFPCLVLDVFEWPIKPFVQTSYAAMLKVLECNSYTLTTDKAAYQTGWWPWCALIWWHLPGWRRWDAGGRWLWKWEWWRLRAIWETEEIWWSMYLKVKLHHWNVSGLVNVDCVTGNHFIAGGSWEENWQTASKERVGGTKVIYF